MCLLLAGIPVIGVAIHTLCLGSDAHQDNHGTATAAQACSLTSMVLAAKGIQSWLLKGVHSTPSVLQCLPKEMLRLKNMLIRPHVYLPVNAHNSGRQ